MSMRERIAEAAWEAYTGYVTRIPWNQAGPYKRAGHYRIADAVLAVLPMPSAEVRKAMRAMKADMKLMAQLLLDHGIVPPMLPHTTSDVRAAFDAYLAALEDAE